MNWPSFSEEEIDAVARILRSGRVNYWTGEECHSFEKEFASFVGTNYAIAMTNGTMALEAALFACGIGPEDDVIVPSRTFVASASCAVMRGARPVMADIDRTSQNLTVETIRAAFTPRTRAIVAVHLAGWPCDMDPIMDFARENNLKVIEDCAQAHGAKYKGRAVGSIGDAAAFSFCQDKIMTTGGEGGMLVTNNKAIWEKAWSFKDHGKSYDAVHNIDASREFCWLHESFGTNGRMTEMQAAIGRIQLRKLPAWIATRQRNAAILSRCFSDIQALRTTLPTADIHHAYYKYYVFLRPEALKPGWDRDQVMQAIEDEGVPCQSGSCSEIYLEKAFETNELRPPIRHPIAKELGETSLMFLVHPTLTEQDMEYTCRTVKKVIESATLERTKHVATAFV